MKLYLLEREIMEPLTQCLKREYNMDFKTISASFQGLRVISPVQRPDSKTLNPESDKSSESVFFIDEQLIRQIYQLYKEYISNFTPYMNSCQVLLYLYKQFFNIKNENYNAEYSEHITQMLTSDIVLRYIQEQIDNHLMNNDGQPGVDEHQREF